MPNLGNSSGVDPTCPRDMKSISGKLIMFDHLSELNLRYSSGEYTLCLKQGALIGGKTQLGKFRCER